MNDHERVTRERYAFIRVGLCLAIIVLYNYLFKGDTSILIGLTAIVVIVITQALEKRKLEGAKGKKFLEKE